MIEYGSTDSTIGFTCKKKVHIPNVFYFKILRPLGEAYKMHKQILNLQEAENKCGFLIKVTAIYNRSYLVKVRELKTSSMSLTSRIDMSGYKGNKSNKANKSFFLL